MKGGKTGREGSPGGEAAELLQKRSKCWLGGKVGKTFRAKEAA